MAAAGGAGHRARPRGHGSGVGVRIVILYDPGAADWTAEDIRGVMKAVDEIAAIFGALGHEIRKVPVRHDMRWFQVARRADLVFNLCEGVHGKSEWEEHVVGSLEFAGVPRSPTPCSPRPGYRSLAGPSRKGTSTTTSPSRPSSNRRPRTRAPASTAARSSPTAKPCGPAS